MLLHDRDRAERNQRRCCCSQVRMIVIVQGGDEADGRVTDEADGRVTVTPMSRWRRTRSSRAHVPATQRHRGVAPSPAPSTSRHCVKLLYRQQRAHPQAHSRAGRGPWDPHFHHLFSMFFLICWARVAKFSASLSSSADCSVILCPQRGWR